MSSYQYQERKSAPRTRARTQEPAGGGRCSLLRLFAPRTGKTKQASQAASGCPDSQECAAPSSIAHSDTTLAERKPRIMRKCSMDKGHSAAPMCIAPLPRTWEPANQSCRSEETPGFQRKMIPSRESARLPCAAPPAPAPSTGTAPGEATRATAAVSKERTQGRSQPAPQRIERHRAGERRVGRGRLPT
mgnify:FL=1